MRNRILKVLFFVCALLVLPGIPLHAEARCFPETGFCIDGKIRTFWEKNGGLPVFGFPIGAQEHIISEDKAITMQRFERNRIELHPWNSAPYDVQLGRLGDTKLKQQNRDWFAFPTSATQTGCRFFVETNHNVCGEILKAWRKNGLQLDSNKAVSEAESMALFGLPLSNLMTETLSDGKEYQVQWFERARFELHPENTAPYNVLLGLLGNETGKFGLMYNPDKFLDLSDADATGDDKPLTDYLFNVEEFPVGSTQHYNKSWEHATIDDIDTSQALNLHHRRITVAGTAGIRSFTTVILRTYSAKGAHNILLNWYNKNLSETINNKTENVVEFYPNFVGIDEVSAYCTRYGYTVMPAGVKLKFSECTDMAYYLRKENILLRIEADPKSIGLSSKFDEGDFNNFIGSLVNRFSR